MTIGLREAIENVDRYFEQSGLMTESWPVVMEAARSLLPRTKMVEVWRVEFAFADGLGWHARTATFKCEDDALAALKGNSKSLFGKWSCIRLTGPHQQEVPA